MVRGIALGTAPNSWGIWFGSDDRQMSWDRGLDEIRDVGYKWIELGLTDISPLTLVSDAQNWNGVSCESRQLWPWALLMMRIIGLASRARFVGACESLSAVGAGYLIVIDGTYSDLFSGEMLRSPSLDDAGWANLIETTHRVAQMASERYGLRAMFRPHAEAHVEYENQIERFLKDPDPAVVGLCLDTGHDACRGGNPVGFVRSHIERIEYFHLKNVDRELREKIVREGIPFARAVELGVFCEPMYGIVDFADLTKVLVDTGFSGHATVEQDMYPTPPEKPLPVAIRTSRFLRELGLAS